MLQRTAKLVAECHRRAAESAQSANNAHNVNEREFYLDVERRWLYLANSYEFTDRVTSMSSELGRHYGKRK
jgi:hypothetical protein